MLRGLLEPDAPAVTVAVAPAPPDAARLAPADLAELLGAVSEVTARLQATHEALRAQVASLQQELGAARAQLQRARELAALGEMAAGIAHEVRNPLGSIRLYASMLEQDLADRPDQRQAASKIGAATRSLDRIVGDVLDFAREVRLRPEAVEAGALFDRALEQCVERIDGARAGVDRLDRAPGAEAVLFVCDAALVQQALANLIRNAADAIAESDRPRRPRRIRLDARRRTVREADGAVRRMVALTVRDTGPGVPDDVLGRMFNPFFTTRRAGTGLGLAIVHRIADAHGGRVEVTNAPEGGAVVGLLLPEAPRDPQHHAPAPAGDRKEATHAHGSRC